MLSILNYDESIDMYACDYFSNIINSTEDIENPFTFTGREWDAEAGLYYYRNRYYDPDIGRFISEDPLGPILGETNLYAYVGNNPLRWIDPWGLYWAEILTTNNRYGNYIVNVTYGANIPTSPSYAIAEAVIASWANSRLVYSFITEDWKSREEFFKDYFDTIEDTLVRAEVKIENIGSSTSGGGGAGGLWNMDDQCVD